MRTRILTSLFLATAAMTLPGAGRSQPGQGQGIVAGESVIIAGGQASTWARINGRGKVIWVGLTIPLSMVEDQPGPGTGPAGAIAVLNYPAVVQQTT